jgi:hypothetical protein
MTEQHVAISSFGPGVCALPSIEPGETRASFIIMKIGGEKRFVPASTRGVVASLSCQTRRFEQRFTRCGGV